MEVTMELLERISKMSLEDFSGAFTVSEAQEIQEYCLEKIKNDNPGFYNFLQAIQEECTNNEIDMQTKMLSRYGKDPMIFTRLISAENEEAETCLMIDGVINVFPVKTSIYDALMVAMLVGQFVNIPDDRNVVVDHGSFPEDIIQTPWTDIDQKWYFEKIASWLMGEVDPKPKKINFSGNKFKLTKNGLYKRTRF